MLVLILPYTSALYNYLTILTMNKIHHACYLITTDKSVETLLKTLSKFCHSHFILKKGQKHYLV
jgi:hypothetical protein